MTVSNLITTSLEEIKQLIDGNQYNVLIKLLADNYIYPSAAVLAENKDKDYLQTINILKSVLDWVHKYPQFDLKQSEVIFSLIITQKDLVDALIIELKKRSLFSDQLFMKALLISKDHFMVLFNLVKITQKSNDIYKVERRRHKTIICTPAQAISKALPYIVQYQYMPMLGNLLTQISSEKGQELFAIKTNAINLEFFVILIQALCDSPAPADLAQFLKTLLTLRNKMPHFQLNNQFLLALCWSKHLGPLLQELTCLNESQSPNDKLFMFITQYSNIIFPILIQENHPKQVVEQLRWMSCTIPLELLKKCTEQQVEKLIWLKIKNPPNSNSKLILTSMLSLFHFANQNNDIDDFTSQYFTQEVETLIFESPLQTALKIQLICLDHKKMMNYSDYGKDYLERRFKSKESKPVTKIVSYDLCSYDYIHHCESEDLRPFVEVIRKVYGFPITTAGKEWFLRPQLQLLDLQIEDKLICQMVYNHLGQSFQIESIAEKKRCDKAPPVYNPLFYTFNKVPVDPWKIKIHVLTQINKQIKAISLLHNNRMLESDWGLLYVIYVLNSPASSKWAKELIQLHSSGDALYWKEWFSCIPKQHYVLPPKKVHSIFSALEQYQLLCADYVKLIMTNPQPEVASTALVRLKENNMRWPYPLASDYYKAVCVAKNPDVLVDNLCALINQGMLDLLMRKISSQLIVNHSPEYFTQCLLIMLKHHLQWTAIRNLLSSCSDLEALSSVLTVIDSKELWENDSYTTHIVQLLTVKNKLAFALYLDRYPKVSDSDRIEYDDLVQKMDINLEMSIHNPSIGFNP